MQTCIFWNWRGSLWKSKNYGILSQNWLVFASWIDCLKTQASPAPWPLWQIFGWSSLNPSQTCVRSSAGCSSMSGTPPPMSTWSTSSSGMLVNWSTDQNWSTGRNWSTSPLVKTGQLVRYTTAYVSWSTSFSASYFAPSSSSTLIEAW